jgi:hypothetical protein
MKISAGNASCEWNLVGAQQSLAKDSIVGKAI